MANFIVGKTGMYFLVDTLVNAMEVFHGPGDFADSLASLGIEHGTLMQIYNEYWDLSPYKRAFGYAESFDSEDWENWLGEFGITED